MRGTGICSFPKLEQLSKQIEEYKAATNKFDFVDMIEKYIRWGKRRA